MTHLNTWYHWGINKNSYSFRVKTLQFSKRVTFWFHYCFVDDLDLLSEDYEAVDHRLKLFLDVEVFEEEEELRSFIKVLVLTVRCESIKASKGFSCVNPSLEAAIALLFIQTF